MHKYIISFHDTKKNDVAVTGNKGTNLALLFKLYPTKVPDGFCITTAAYRKFIDSGDIAARIRELDLLSIHEGEAIKQASDAIRKMIKGSGLPEDVMEELKAVLKNYDDSDHYAVRSSATSEDLPDASFAGLHESYLNLSGIEAIAESCLSCWASLFSDPAVFYRKKNGIDHQGVLMAVIVQKFIEADASGVIFTADPFTSDRKSAVVEAVHGLGQSLVSGAVVPDRYFLGVNQSVSVVQGRAETALRSAIPQGTAVVKDKAFTEKQVLSEEQVRELVCLGREIEAHFNCPQDLEWVMKEFQFFLVQTRPITSLFPIPDFAGVPQPRVYMSVGHLQMMTDAIKPLGLSFFEPLAQFTLDRAGGRPFADITHDLTSPVGRKRLIIAAGKQDPLIEGALETIIADKNLMADLPRGKRNLKGGAFSLPALIEAFKISRSNDPEYIEKFVADYEEEIAIVSQKLAHLSGEELFAFIKEDFKKMVEMAYDKRVIGAIVVALLAENYLNRTVDFVLGLKSSADIFSKSVYNNVTTEMGLALSDLADIIRNKPAVLAYLNDEPSHIGFYDHLARFAGGKEVIEGFKTFMARFGMRCPGEIDITRDRWLENPAQLVPLLLSNIRVLSSGEHRERFEEGRREAEEKETEVIEKLKSLRGGKKVALKVSKNISLLRNFCGCREYPKYFIVRRYWEYKQALIREAEKLVQKGVISEKDDLFFLYIDEFAGAVKTGQVDHTLIEKRKREYRHFRNLTPPRVITSDGYVPKSRSFAWEIPDQSLSGIPVSRGEVEGRARVIKDVKDAKIKKGDILVTHFTDPSWTPLFSTVSGLVTEVGGFITHGSIVAREYGLPAVVGVTNATSLIRDGQRIRLNGTNGYVELLD